MLESIRERLQGRVPHPIDERRTYAVLLPLITISGQWHVLYQVRSQLVPQPGEVAFPGGQVEAGEGLQAAAIRETCEELNLSSDRIQILGEIDYMVNGARTIHCFIGILDIDDWTQLKPNQEEVERLFTVPLADLLDKEPRYYTLRSKVIPDADFPFDRITNGPAYDFKEHQRSVPFYDGLPENLWGMTALFTHRFIQIITGRER
ncbi:NUDIX hydrolase [Streptococcus caprae]|uniref:NUDIX hydrolase n=1 Tax=Streptococcus caprae TaxID=1640501 RepID=A0ABV8CXQ1_9STRE